MRRQIIRLALALWAVGPLMLGGDSAAAGQFYSVAISPDGSTLAAGWLDGGSRSELRVYDLENGELRRLVHIKNTEAITDIVFSGNGKRIATTQGIYDYYDYINIVTIWKAHNLGKIQSYRYRWVSYWYSNKLSWSGPYLFISRINQRSSLRVDLRTGESTNFPSTYSSSISPDRKVSVYDWRTVRLYDLKTAAFEMSLQGSPNLPAGGPAVFVANGNRIAASRGNRIEIWGRKGRRIAHTVRHRDGIWSIAPRGSTNQFGVVTRSGDVYIWNSGTGELVRKLTVEDARFYDVAFSADGKIVAAADLLGRIFVWHAHNGKLIRVLR